MKAALNQLGMSDDRMHQRMDMMEVVVSESMSVEFFSKLKNQADLLFTQLTDITVVDYLDYGSVSWETESHNRPSYSRARSEREGSYEGPRFEVIYHLLSHEHRHRLRVRLEVPESLVVSTVTSVWPVANWYEREAFDLFGIVFKGHPDLRRILTDYGFVGHPFRKDFPLIGEVEMRYDGAQGRCIYEAVTIQPRVGMPKVIRCQGSHDRQGDEA